MRIFVGFDQRNWDANKNVEKFRQHVSSQCGGKVMGNGNVTLKEDINIVNSTGDYTVCPLGLPFCKVSVVRTDRLCLIQSGQELS